LGSDGKIGIGLPKPLYFYESSDKRIIFNGVGNLSSSYLSVIVHHLNENLQIEPLDFWIPGLHDNENGKWYTISFTAGSSNLAVRTYQHLIQVAVETLLR
jgi:hypothetical protein